MAKPRITISLDVDDKKAISRINNFYTAANKATREAVTLSRNSANVTKADAQAQTALNRTLETGARVRAANARAALAEGRAIEQATKAAERQRREEERSNRPKRSAFASAVLSSRFSLPGTGGRVQPLVGQTARAAGLGDNLAAGLSIAGGVAGMAGAAFLSEGRKAVNLAADMEKGLNQLQFQSKATAEQMAAVAKEARHLGADVTLPATSSVDATTAMLVMSKAGFSLQDSMDSARGSLALAAAAETDAGTAADITAGQLKAFGLAGSDAGRVADLLAASANNSLGEIGDMAQAAQQAAAVFHQANVPIEDMTTSIALMANAGIKGSDAGTSLKTMMLALIAPTDTAKKKMDELNLAIYDGNGKLLPYRDIIGKVSDSLKGLSEEQRNAALKAIFGTDAIRSANIVLGQGAKAFDEMKQKVIQANAALDTAKSKNEGLKGAIDGLQSSLDTLYEKYGSKSLGFLTGLVKDGTTAIDVMDRLIDRFGKLGGGASGEAIKNKPWWTSFNGIVGHGINAAENALNAADQADRLRTSPGGKMSEAQRVRGLIVSARKNNRTSPELTDALRGIGVDTTFRGNPGEFQAMLDHGLVEINSRIAHLSRVVGSDMQSRLMGAYGASTAKPSGKPTVGGARGGGAGSGGSGVNDGGELTANIIKSIGEGIKTPKGEASCAYFASAVIQATGRKVDKAAFPTVASARGLEQFVKGHGASVVGMAQAKPGDLIGMPGTGASGRHVGIYLGNGRMMDSSGDGPNNQRVKNAPRNGVYYSLGGIGGVDLKHAASAAVAGDRRAETEAAKAERAKEKAENEAKAAKEKAERIARNVAGNRADTRQTRLGSAVDVASGKFDASLAIFDNKGTMETLEEDRQRLVKESKDVLHAELEVIRDRFTSSKNRLKDESDLEYSTRMQAEAAKRDEEAGKARERDQKRIELVGKAREAIRTKHAEDYTKQEQDIQEKRVQAYDENLRLITERNEMDSQSVEQAKRFATTLDAQLALSQQAEDLAKDRAVLDYTKQTNAIQGTLTGETKKNALILALDQLRFAIQNAKQNGIADRKQIAQDAEAESQRRYREQYPNGYDKQAEIDTLRTPQQDSLNKKPKYISSVFGKANDAALSKLGDKAWVFAEPELRNAGERVSTAFIESLAGGKGRRIDMKDVFQNVGRDIGRDLANEAGKGLIDIAEAGGKKMFKYLLDGGGAAAKAIAEAGITLYGVANILGAGGKKKQRSGILGGILGFALGSILPGVGNLEGAGIGAGIASSLGFAKGGRPPVGLFSMVGEKGPELFMPDQPGTILTNEQSRRLLSSGGKSGDSYHKTTNLFISELHEASDMQTIRQHLEDERQREAYV